MVSGFPKSVVVTHLRFMAFHSLMHTDSALPDFRRNMDAYPNHQQNPSVIPVKCNGSHHKQAVSNLTLYKNVLGRICLELFHLTPCELLGLLPSFSLLQSNMTGPVI